MGERKKQRKRMKRGGEASFSAALLQAGVAGGFKIGSWPGSLEGDLIFSLSGEAVRTFSRIHTQA